jgi:hypothetical protein
MNRLTGILGLAWFALFAVGAIVLQGEPPAPGQPVGELRELFSAWIHRVGRWVPSGAEQRMTS